MYNGPMTRAVPPLPGGAPQAPSVGAAGGMGAAPMPPAPTPPMANGQGGMSDAMSTPMPPPQRPPQPGDNAMNMNKPSSPFQPDPNGVPLWLKGFMSSPYAKLMQAKKNPAQMQPMMPPPQAPGQVLQQSGATMNPAPAWAAPANMAR